MSSTSTTVPSTGFMNESLTGLRAYQGVSPSAPASSRSGPTLTHRPASGRVRRSLTQRAEVSSHFSHRETARTEPSGALRARSCKV